MVRTTRWKEVPKEVKEFLKGLEKINELKMIADAIVQEGGTNVDIKKDIDYKYRKWTIFKLIAHLLYTPLYTSIIKNYFAEFYYVDLFAGSGFGYLSEEDVSDIGYMGTAQNIRIAGSPLIASSIVKEHFARLYLNDISQAKIQLLRKRMEVLTELSKSPRKHLFPLSPSSLSLERIRTYDVDANEAIKRIMREIEENHERIIKEKKKGCHVYFFIDPEGLEFKRASLERIVGSKVRSDVIILFNSYGAALQAYNHIHHGRSDSALRECLGNDYIAWIEDYAKRCGKKLKELSIRELADALLNGYQSIFKSKYEMVVIKLSLIEPTKAKSQEQKREFDLIFATRKTRAGNPYIKGFRYIKNFIENVARKLGYDHIINEFLSYVATGEMPGLLKFIIEDPKEVFERYSTLKRYSGKKSTKIGTS